MYTKQEEGVD
jgi:hypothetical protein